MAVSYPPAKCFSAPTTSTNPAFLLLNESAFVAAITIPVAHSTVWQRFTKVDYCVSCTFGYTLTHTFYRSTVA